MLGMTFTDTTAAPARFELVAIDLYRDIHKAIRTELFAVTTSAGQTDPSDRAARVALAAHVARHAVGCSRRTPSTRTPPSSR